MQITFLTLGDCCWLGWLMGCKKTWVMFDDRFASLLQVQRETQHSGIDHVIHIINTFTGVVSTLKLFQICGGKLWLGYLKVLVCNYFLVIFAKIVISMTVESDTGQLSVAPPSGPYLICKNPLLPDQLNQSELRGVSERCQSLLCIKYWAVPLPHTGAGSALTWLDMLQPELKTMAENRQQQQSRNMPHHRPRQREEIRRLTKKSSAKTKNWTKPERKQG